MARRMGFCIRDLTPGVGRRYLARTGNKGWLDGGDELVMLWPSVDEAERHAKTMNCRTEVVPYVDRPLERPEPDQRMARGACYKLKDVLAGIDSARSNLDPTQSYGTTAEWEKLPERYCAALNALKGAADLIAAARAALEPRPPFPAATANDLDINFLAKQAHNAQSPQEREAPANALLQHARAAGLTQHQIETAPTWMDLAQLIHERRSGLDEELEDES